MRWNRNFQRAEEAGAEAGELVAVLSIGCLGHMALQYARRRDFKVVAVGRGRDVTENALKLGAHVDLE